MWSRFTIEACITNIHTKPESAHVDEHHSVLSTPSSVAGRSPNFSSHRRGINRAGLGDARHGYRTPLRYHELPVTTPNHPSDQDRALDVHYATAAVVCIALKGGCWPTSSLQSRLGG
jgi:hypothetical protein